jgi:WD40 repeat protein
VASAKPQTYLIGTMQKTKESEQSLTKDSQDSIVSSINVGWIVLGLLFLVGASTFGIWLFNHSPFNLTSAPKTTSEKPLPTTLAHTKITLDAPVFAVAVSPDGNTYLSGSGKGAIQRWQFKTGKLLQTYLGHTGEVVSLAIASDNRTLVSGSRDKTVRVWDLETGKLRHTLSAGNEWVKGVAISPDGALVVSGNKDRHIKIWATKTGALVKTLEPNQDSIEAIAFSPDGLQFASSGEDTTIKIWNKFGKPIRTLIGHKGHPEAISFTPDSKHLISGEKIDLRQWDLRTGKVTQIFSKPFALVRSLCISQDGTRLVSGHADHTIKVWNLKTGQQEQKITGHKDWVLSVALSPDGKTLISGSRDKTIQSWALQPIQRRPPQN